MKGMDMSCASQAATAICLSTEKPPSSSSTSAVLLGREIDRHNPIIRDARRIPKQILAPCTASQAPISPKSLKTHHQSHKKLRNEMKIIPKELNGDAEEMKRSSSGQKRENGVRRAAEVIGRKSWSCTRSGEFISPPGSTRYLLGEKVVCNTLSDLDSSVKKATAADEDCKKENESCHEKTPAFPDQVVVLRVSLHCRGCEKKMRKHISRMEGVTSFEIDFAAKKVTVSGNITPLEVLSSISKVKNAQLWSPTVAASTNQPVVPLQYLQTKPEISTNADHQGSAE